MKRLLKLCVAAKYKIKYAGRCRMHLFTNIILRRCNFEGKNAIGNGTYLSAVQFGYGSYTGEHCELSETKIGRFCAIGNYVRIVTATHPIDKNVSIHPAFYSPKYYFSYFKDERFSEHLTTESGFGCEIGNDVWIGDNVLIKGGITIGDGAVIGMGSIVTHNVPPYTVVAGVPAKEIKKRFDAETVEKLLNIKWWERPIDWIAQNAADFPNVNEFVEKYTKEDD